MQVDGCCREMQPCTRSRRVLAALSDGVGPAGGGASAPNQKKGATGVRNRRVRIPGAADSQTAENGGRWHSGDSGAGKKSGERYGQA